MRFVNILNCQLSKKFKRLMNFGHVNNINTLTLSLLSTLEEINSLMSIEIERYACKMSGWMEKRTNSDIISTFNEATLSVYIVGKTHF